MRNPRLVQLANRWGAFRRAEHGNVAITFAVSLIPLLGLVGMAIDYSRANGLRATMQAAADSTALAVAREAPNETATVLQNAGNTYYRALFTRTDALGLTTNTVYTPTPSPQVVVTASASIKPRFMSMWPFNIGSVPINVSATTAWGNTRLRVALVLDNTGSMSETDSTGTSKMTALKRAAHNLLAQLQGAATNNGDVYVSIIPFNTSVNVGASNYTQTWIDWSDWEDDNGSWTTSTTCTGSSRRGRSRCTSTQTWVPDNHNTWNGCVTDRDKNFDTDSTVPNPADATLPGSVPSTLFPAESDGGKACPTAIMPMSYDWVNLNRKIDLMTPNGATNQTIGLAWGWLSLLQQSPLNAPAMDPNYTYQKVIILLSDGLNTQNRWDGDGHNQSPPVDAREQILCNNINNPNKNTGITIYTVLVMAGDSTVLKNCTSKDGKYFALTSANQIVDTFNEIGTNLSRLRIAK